MRSIRTKILLITITAVIVSVLLVGGVGVLFMKNEGERQSDKEMKLLCDNKRKTLNEYMKSIEQSVNMVTHYAVDDINGEMLVEGGVVGVLGQDTALEDRDWQTDQQKRLDEYLAEHQKNVETVFQSVADHTNGVIAYYYRMNPEITKDNPGFFYIKTDAQGFVMTTPTDILAYSRDDVTRVGWYYLPLEQEHPIWINPYYNANMDVKMISYVAPIYKAGSFLGVIGMDISYETLLDQVENIQIYETGYACLVDSEGMVVYHPTLEPGTLVEDIVPAMAKAASDQNLGENDVYIFRYTYDGLEKKAVFAMLENGLQLIIMAPSVEINDSWYDMLKSFLFIGGAVLLVFAIVVTIAMQFIIEPLQKLTAAAQRLTDGDYNVNLEYNGEDEVGILTRSFDHLVDYLKVLINDLNSKAYKDELTSVRNKGAFDIMARGMDEKIPPLDDHPLSFAIVMFDCNDVGKINDQYGHANGDSYLKTCCMFICKVFAHSPVFRIGGDEFVTVLQKVDYEHREELLKTFDELIAMVNDQAENPWEGIGISRGIAVYDPDTDGNVEAVLTRANDELYKEKDRAKANRSK